MENGKSQGGEKEREREKRRTSFTKNFLGPESTKVY